MQRSPNKTAPSKFPPNPLQWGAERNGLALRSHFDKPLHLPLQPFEIAKNIDGVTLLSQEQFESVIGEECAARLFGVHRRSWSGFVVPVEGWNVVVINSTHPVTRQHATLMEELFHIRLRHVPTKISLCPQTKLMRREYAKDIEHDAYWSAAAALVPYFTLKEMLASGMTIEAVAEFFGVSVDLVRFRMNVTKLARKRR
jgi:hypothetical protein